MPIIGDESVLAEQPPMTLRRACLVPPARELHDHRAGLTIGLVNNMPDSALESTERQFLSLIDEASTQQLVQVKLFSIDGVPRSDRGRQHIRKYYSNVRELFNRRLDALIVTGTEPRARNLADEPYWSSLTEVIDWAQRNTTTTIFSCLGAHAAVLHLDGISRRPLPEKQFGVFKYRKTSEHYLLKGAPARMATPHSRWNEVPAAALASSGYKILAESRAAGVDLFIKEGDSLFVFLQGHPEYQAETLWREYRRDVGRFLRGEQPRYPALPNGYFTQPIMRALQEFRGRAESERREQVLSEFPVAQVPSGIAATWREQAIRVYRNWLSYMAAHRARMENSRFATAWPASAAP